MHAIGLPGESRVLYSHDYTVLFISYNAAFLFLLVGGGVNDVKVKRPDGLNTNNLSKVRVAPADNNNISRLGLKSCISMMIMIYFKLPPHYFVG